MIPYKNINNWYCFWHNITLFNRLQKIDYKKIDYKK